MIALVLAAAMLAADTNHFVVCPMLPPASDTVSETVYGRVWDPFTRLALPVGFTGVIAEAVRAKMSIPARAPIVVFDAQGRPTVVTTAAFSIFTDGTIRNVTVIASSSAPGIDSLLIGGLELAARDSSLPPLPSAAGNGIRLAFALSTDSAAGAAPMFSIRVPRWRDFVPARPIGKPDTVAAAVIIDEKGVALLGTIESERPLPLGQLDWFRNTRFVPGHIHPCAVRSLVSVRR